MAYTYQDIIDKCEEAFQNINAFYQAKVVNYKGKTKDTDEYYSEVVAKFLLDNIDKFKQSIQRLMRN